VNGGQLSKPACRLFWAQVAPALKPVRVPKQTMANFAMQYLKADSNFEVRNQMSMVLPIELIVRETCGAKLGLGEQP
jgi:DNA-binding LacI/PurR family transcriptional regulator